jgi:hypothetical protein
VTGERRGEREASCLVRQAGHPEAKHA